MLSEMTLYMKYVTVVGHVLANSGTSLRVFDIKRIMICDQHDTGSTLSLIDLLILVVSDGRSERLGSSARLGLGHDSGLKKLEGDYIIDLLIQKKK